MSNLERDMASPGDLMEQVADPELVDASFLAAPRSDELESFRRHYMNEVRQSTDDVADDRVGD